MATHSFNPNLNWKQAFENAIGELHGSEVKPVKRSRANTPIYQRKSVEPAPVQPEQAVATAAEALAALWKTSRAKNVRQGSLSADGRRPQ